MEYFDEHDNLNTQCYKCKRGIFEHSTKAFSEDDMVYCNNCDECVGRHEEISEGFDRFLVGIEEKESINRTKKFLHEESNARKLINKYSETAQNRTVYKKESK